MVGPPLYFARSVPTGPGTVPHVRRVAGEPTTAPGAIDDKGDKSYTVTARTGRSRWSPQRQRPRCAEG